MKRTLPELQVCRLLVDGRCGVELWPGERIRATVRGTVRKVLVVVESGCAAARAFCCRQDVRGPV
ncbi:hypothetical protein [Desulfobulbus oligotrophicus]|uniref:Uncharacterized protein n=1 Tax=Desulfobulbus oligotrophicus TaxID=1909699 RepID=A0A7T6AQN9_9BACT|nr:hypothetical protein [Desulfobulbus oligotrophicus]QQG65946.1 hypothetical protein HP555_08735 [Desulfobulbus oligotrophicus]